jgi:hypothetical protein
MIPTQTTCVNAMSWSTGSTPTAAKWDPTPGQQGERHNGALNFIVVKSTTPASALELNVAGKPEYGWRVKRADWNAWVLAEYTVFWHHPNGKCYTSGSGWTQAPPQDFDDNGGKTSTPASGSDDPKDGDFGGTAGTVVSTTTTTNDNVTTTVTTYADGSVVTIVTTTNADGSKTVVTTNADGSTTTITLSPTGLISGADESSLQPKTGRISWREMYR